VEPGDVIILATDGVYENFDPEFLGLGPRDIGLKKESWAAMRPEKATRAKTSYIEHVIERTIANARGPAQIEKTLLEHARLVTIPRKAFMEREGKTPPRNYVEHPGRLDHATVCCFVVQKEYPNYNLWL